MAMLVVVFQRHDATNWSSRADHVMRSRFEQSIVVLCVFLRFYDECDTSIIRWNHNLVMFAIMEISLKWTYGTSATRWQHHWWHLMPL